MYNQSVRYVNLYKSSTDVTTKAKIWRQTAKAQPAMSSIRLNAVQIKA